MMSLLAVVGISRFAPSAVEVYRDLQARLARYASVRLITIPTTGNGWDHEGLYGYLRPNKGFRQEPNLSFATDGKYSWGIALENQRRPSKSDDLFQFMGLRGFETYFNPTTTVAGKRSPYSVVRGSKKLIALDLTIAGEIGTLYLDSERHLPFGWTSGNEGVSSLSRIYWDIHLGVAIPSEWLKGPKFSMTDK